MLRYLALLCVCLVAVTGETIFAILRTCAPTGCKRIGSTNATIVTFDSSQNPVKYNVLNSFTDLTITPGAAFARPTYDADNQFVWSLFITGASDITLVAFNRNGAVARRFKLSQFSNPNTLSELQYDPLSKTVLIYATTAGFCYISTKDGSTVKQVSATGNFNLVTVDTANRQMYFTNYANHRGNTMINGLTASNIDNGQVRESNVTFVAGVTDNLYAQFLNAIPNSQSVVGMYQLSGFLESYTVITNCQANTAAVSGQKVPFVPFRGVSAFSPVTRSLYTCGEGSDGSATFATVNIKTGDISSSTVPLSGNTGYMTGMVTVPIWSS